jgi:hypothetical protein
MKGKSDVEKRGTRKCILLGQFRKFENHVFGASDIDRSRYIRRFRGAKELKVPLEYHFILAVSYYYRQKAGNKYIKCLIYNNIV